VDTLEFLAVLVAEVVPEMAELDPEVKAFQAMPLVVHTLLGQVAGPVQMQFVTTLTMPLLAEAGHIQ
jgi:hypothetical protein